MLLTRLLNACHHFPGFVYTSARLCDDAKAIEIDVRPRLGSKPCCSGCGQSATVYDHRSYRRFEFIPIWGFTVFLLYRMRRVD
jgi:transposase